MPSLSIARLDVILQHHFIFEHIDLRTDRNLSNTSSVTSPSSSSASAFKGEGRGGELGSREGVDRNINSYRNELERVYSDQRPILNPAELAEMEVLLGSKSGIKMLLLVTIVACLCVFFITVASVSWASSFV